MFQGCSETKLPQPQGIAATWHFIKAITGNTLPAAVLPFGKYSCCAYTEGYPGGYGDHLPNSCPSDLRFLSEGARFRGLSHFHQSGTGAIDYYYNYAVTQPYMGLLPPENGCGILSQEGTPGYYSVTGEDGIRSEAAVSHNSVYHRFTFPGSGGRIAVDFTNDGLMKTDSRMYSRPQSGKVSLLSETEVCAEVTLDGLKQYFYYKCEGARVVSLLRSGEPVPGRSAAFGETKDTYGVLFKAEGETVNGCLGASFKSAQAAKEDCLKDEGGFDEVRLNAYRQWNEKLGSIEIESSDEKELEIFYSNLYHSIIKPSDRSGECPLWQDDGFVVDFSTMWDIYKTQLPLVLTLYPEAAQKIVNTILDCGRHLGAFPHTMVMREGFLEDSLQACMLAEYTVCDAFYRGVKADYADALERMVRDIYRPSYKNLIDGELPPRITHILDAADACAAVAQLARLTGYGQVAQKLEKTAQRRAECYDSETGLLKADADYYEGNVWNYSFRLHPDMERRIEVAGGTQSFTALLDRFFGYTFPESVETRFEGFNNEPDMETPYAYHFVGRHDRISEIIDASRKYMFVSGNGGLPGNNDSGGLSSCFVWNAIGIFPVTGQDLMIIGTPLYKKAVLHLQNGKTFTVERSGEGIYVKRAALDGQTLAKLEFPVTRMMRSGTLTLEMCNEI